MKRKVIGLILSLSGAALLVVSLVFIGKGGKFYWWILGGLGLVITIIGSSIEAKKEKLPIPKEPACFKYASRRSTDSIKYGSTGTPGVEFGKKKDTPIDTKIKSINLDD